MSDVLAVDRRMLGQAEAGEVRLTDPPITNISDLQTILANQRRLGKRILWLLFLPFIITMIVVWMFHNLSARLADVEVGTKLVSIERFVLTDQNYPSAIAQYEQLARIDGRASIL